MTDMRTIETDGKHVPEPLKSADMWVTWSPDNGKVALAPWQHGHMYPADWAKDKDVDPRTTYEQAASVASMSPEQIHKQWPFPEGPPDTVLPAVLLPPAEADNDFCFVDLDDVIIDGEITQEAWDILTDLGGYAEVSKSYMDGKDVAGVHAWVRGSLPDGLGKFIAPLNGPGQLEIYDHGRMTGGTWRRVRGAPANTIPKAQETVERLVSAYEVKSCPECETQTRKRDLSDENPECPSCGYEFTTKPGIKEAIPSSSSGPSGYNLPGQDSNDNPYYDIDIRQVADTGAFRSYRDDPANPVSRSWQGPSPKHGGTKTDDKKSANFAVNTDTNEWYCFAHGVGGGPMSLIAQLEGVTSCSNSLSIHNNPKKLLKTALAARDKYDMGGKKPPYEALVQLAKMVDMPMADRDAGKLGKVNYKHTLKIFEGVEDWADLKAQVADMD